jgi:hypothetical protein
VSGPRVTRRRALALGIALGMAATGAIVVRRGRTTIFGPPRPALREALDSVLSDHDSTRRVGLAYLRIEPAEAWIDLLLDRLPIPGRAADDVEATIVADPPAALARIGAGTTSEFSRGDTVIVDGWEIGRSHGRLAALYLMLSS